MSSSDQSPPDDGSGVDYAMMIGAAIVLSFVMYVLIAVVALVSVTAFLLALPLFAPHIANIELVRRVVVDAHQR